MLELACDAPTPPLGAWAFSVMRVSRCIDCKTDPDEVCAQRRAAPAKGTARALPQTSTMFRLLVLFVFVLKFMFELFVFSLLE